MPAVLSKGLNHALPLRQDLHLNTWTKKEKQILMDIKPTMQMQNYKKGITDDSKIGVIMACQRAMLKRNFIRTSKAIEKKWRTMGLSSLPFNPSLHERPSEVSSNCWMLAQDAIAQRVLGEFSNTERGVQVDELFYALKDYGIPEKRTKCARIIRDLFPMNVSKWRRWSNEEKAVGKDIMTEHIAHLADLMWRLNYQVRLLPWGSEGPYTPGNTSLIRIGGKITPMHQWTCLEVLLLDMIDTEMPNKSGYELRAMISERHLTKLNIERTPRVCGTRLERTQKKREITELDDKDETAELPVKRSRTTVTPPENTSLPIPGLYEILYVVLVVFESCWAQLHAV